MRILYVAMQYDYGDRSRGYGFEHYNFFDALHNMGHDLLYFDFASLLQQYGRAAMNRRLREVAKAEKPDLLFCLLYKDEFDRGTMRAISESGDTVTVNWFCDDHWRFEDYSRHWAPCFNWAVTTAEGALPKYAQAGFRHVIKSQWACNHYLYHKLDLPMQYDVSFIGQPHGNRRATIAMLRDAGIPVHTWGSGWENGRVDQQQMIAIFNQSRINLNLANASQPLTRMHRVRVKMKAAISRALEVLPGGRALKATVKTAKASHAAQAPLPLLPEQIKGRNFEVPGSGGFLLTSPVEDLDRYYAPEREISLFADDRQLVERIRYYLDHEDERTAIAQAGYQRTLSEHTYVHRFREIFRRIGLPGEEPDTIIARGARPGRVEEIA